MDLKESRELSRSLATGLTVMPDLRDLVISSVSFHETFYVTLAESRLKVNIP